LPKNKKYQVFELSGKFMAYSNENLEGEIINEFKLSEGQPCMDPSRSNYSND